MCSKQEKIQTSFFIHSNCSTTNTEVEIERKKLFKKNWNKKIHKSPPHHLEVAMFFFWSLCCCRSSSINLLWSVIIVKSKTSSVFFLVKKKCFPFWQWCCIQHFRNFRKFWISIMMVVVTIFDFFFLRYEFLRFEHFRKYSNYILQVWITL